MKILNRYTDEIIYEDDAETMRETVVKAIASGANLSDADLSGANLRDANLRDANLRDADLSGANLRGADLRGANLRDADLSDADLSGANLRDANLSGADLRDANLRGADLSGAKFSIPFTPDPQLINKVAAKALATNDALDMDIWHTCETTHCIAGWANHLHPEGRLLEHFTSPYLAARLLLGDEAASHFFDSNDAAREWLKQFLPT